LLFRNIADYWTLVIRAEMKAFNRKDRFCKGRKARRLTAEIAEYAEEAIC
jgi:hypothetical protein